MPPVPDGGLLIIQEGPCTDMATGAQGYCVLCQDRRGINYVIFKVGDEVQEIRQITGNTYTVIWSAVAGELT